MSNSAWDISDLSRQDGRTFLITGANSGIGLAAARELAKVGGRVVLAVRSLDKGRAAQATIEGDTEVLELDLSDLASVRAFAEAWEGDIDVLVNNAGVMAPPQGRTKDGFELQIGTNHLGHFALTNLLLGHITERVVTIASGAHRLGKIDLADLNWETRKYDRWRAYGQSKLANLLFTLELQRRLEESDSPVRAVAAHPGYSATNLQSHTENFVQNLIMKVANVVVAQSDERGGWPTLYAATQDIPGGLYVGPDGFQEMRGRPKPVSRSGAAQDTETARALWELSEQLTGVAFRVPARV